MTTKDGRIFSVLVAWNLLHLVAASGVVALWVGGALAAPVSPKGTVTQGMATVTCGEFAQAYRRSSDIELAFFSWAQGFVTGINLKMPDESVADVSRMSVAEQRRRIREFCDAHPLLMYIEAAINLYNALPVVPPGK